MNEKIYIQRKYNKCINILLAIYVVLCLVLSLLFNGFFIKPKAFSNENTYTLNGTLSMIGGNSYNTSQLRCTSTGRTKTIFYSDPEFEELMNENYIANDTDSVSLFRFADDYNMGGTFTQDIVNVDDHGMGATCWNYIGYVGIGEDTPIWQYFHNKGVDLPVDYYRPWVLYMAHTYNQDADKLASISLESDIEYVDTPQALYKYMVNSDDSVVKIGKPTEPNVTEDGNLPTPQKVNLWESAQNCAGLTWDNPKSINKYIKDLGDNVGIEIEWKPSIALTLGMLTVDSLTSSEWLPVYKGVISKSGSLINAFVSKKNDNSRLDNNLNGFNYEIDDKFIFTPTVNDNDYLEQIAKNNHVRLWYANEDNVRGGSLNESDVKNFKKNTFNDSNDSNDLKSTKNVVGGEVETPAGEEGVNVAPSGINKLDLIQGIITGVGKVGKWIFDSFQIDTSNYRVRYYVKDGNKYSVSNWVDAKRGYDTNENAKEPTNVNFTDSNNNPVSNPTYLPVNQVTSSDSANNSWWDRFYTENNNVLANLQTAFANFTADSGDFFGFFRALFTEFPEFYIFLCMGLGLAIMLRILGR